MLYLTKYTRMGPSSRMRSFQYVPYLQQHGIAVTLKPLFGDDYLTDLFSGKKSLPPVLKAYWRRFWVLFTVFSYDGVVIEKGKGFNQGAKDEFAFRRW